MAQIALDLAKRHPELTARQIGDLVNKEIDGYVTHTYIQRILQEARQAGMLPPSPRPGPHTRWGYIGRPIPG